MASTYPVKRAYDPPSDDDGRRVLVDRLWPRGRRKEAARIDLWAKDATPSNDLRKWYHADKESRRAEFRERYETELEESAAQDALQKIRDLHSVGPVTLVTANRDVEDSHVPVLVDALQRREKRGKK
jgi:uncharacterized protein YeaO (DUF488 family)